MRAPGDAETWSGRNRQKASRDLNMRFNRIIPVLVMVPLLGCDDEFQGASRSVEKSWPVTTSPTIIVDACGGGIWVRRGPANEVKVKVARNSSCKNKSWAYAEDSLRFIDVEMNQEADTVRIVSRRTDDGATECYLTTSVEVYVPDGARLDLTTDVGSIWVEGSLREVRATNSAGAAGFELELPGQGTGETRPIKLEGWGGRVDIKLGSKGYEYSGSVKMVEEFR
jgi:hypothetical protein